MLRCPNCSGEMREVRKHGVHIDYCPVCRGIWLDRGEVDKIVLSAPAAAVSEETAEENIVAGNGERGYELNRILSELRKDTHGDVVDCAHGNQGNSSLHNQPESHSLHEGQ